MPSGDEHPGEGGRDQGTYFDLSARFCRLVESEIRRMVEGGEESSVRPELAVSGDLASLPGLVWS